MKSLLEGLDSHVKYLAIGILSLANLGANVADVCDKTLHWHA